MIKKTIIVILAAILLSFGLTSCYSGPSLESIQQNAGLSDPSILTPSGSIFTSSDNQIIENLDINGNIIVNHDNVTIRNVRITGTSDTALIKNNSGVRGTTVEHCRIHVTDDGANGAIGYLGYETTVRYCEITGFADGIKVEGGTESNPSLYEHNYIHMSKPVGSSKHLDGIQASGDSYFEIRFNAIDAHIDNGGNAAIFIQAWWGAGSAHTYNPNVHDNILQGGNYTVYLEGGKPNDPRDGQPEGFWMHDYQFNDNAISNEGFRSGKIRVDVCDDVTTTGNKTFNNSGQIVDINPC